MAKFWKKEKNEVKDRVDNLSLVAQQVIEIIVRAKLPMGNVVDAKDAKKFKPEFKVVANEILGVLLENNIRHVDRNFLFQLILQPFDVVKQILEGTFKLLLEGAETKLFGKKYEDVTLKDLDNILK